MHIPIQAPWLGEYLHEIAIFPNGRFDDQVDSTSQTLDWFKEQESEPFLPEFIGVEIPHVPFTSRSHAAATSGSRGWATSLA